MTESTNTANSGISREEAESILKKFLDNENYKVLAVNGKWGVGKTHLVQNFLFRYIKEYYYYASVFGVSSIEQLKARIIANYKSNIEISNQFKSELHLNSVNKFLNNIFEWVNRNFGKIERTRKIDIGLPGQSSISLAGSLISVAGDLALNILFNENVRNSIICIDDLERKSKLPLEELLGFVEYLVQELKCKIILIYDEDILLENQDSKEVLKKYQEKVIDRKFKFAPTVEENLDFGFKNHPDIEVIKPVFIKTETNNIRVIRKTKWLLDELIPLMEGWQPSLRNQVIKNSIVISLTILDSEFCKNFSLSIDNIFYLLEPSKYINDKTFEERLKVGQQVLNLGYSPLYTDDLIIKLVEKSWSNSDELEFIKRGENLNKREQKNQIIDKLRSLGKPYYNSFGDSEKEIIEEINNFLEEYHLDLSISEFEQIEKFASVIEMDISHYEKSLLEHMLKTLEPHYFNDLTAFKIKLRKYPDLENKIVTKKNEYLQKLNITEAITKIIKSDDLSVSLWFQTDVKFLNNCTVDEYAKWLEEGQPDLYLMVKQFLNLGLPASQNLEQAIRILATKSKLNQSRAKSLYNIDIEKNSHTNDGN